MQEKKPGKKSFGTGVIAIGVAIFVVIFILEIYSQSRNFGVGNGPGIIPAAFGILFVSIALYEAVKCFRGETDEEGNPAEKPGNSTGNEELVSRIVGAVKESAQSREKAEPWTCAYCKTTVDGDSAFCPACGAGRKGKQ